MKKKNTYEVYLPCVYSEIYSVEAVSEKQAIELVRGGHACCIGESRTGEEHLGIKAVLIKKKGVRKNEKNKHKLRPSSPDPQLRKNLA